MIDQVGAEERAERAQRQAEESAGPSQKKAAPSQRKAAPKKKAIPPELQECQERASARMLELDVPPLQESHDGKRRCPVCRQLCTANDKMPDGKIHRVLGRSNKIWCPYADDISLLETFENKQKERTQAAWRRVNEAIEEKAAFLIILFIFSFASLIHRIISPSFFVIFSFASLLHDYRITCQA